LDFGSGGGLDFGRLGGCDESVLAPPRTRGGCWDPAVALKDSRRLGGGFVLGNGGAWTLALLPLLELLSVMVMRSSSKKLIESGRF